MYIRWHTGVRQRGGGGGGGGGDNGVLSMLDSAPASDTLLTIDGCAPAFHAHR